jgi:hypothetical protein
MSWKTKARRVYEARVMKEILAKLEGRIDLNSLPLSKEQLQTLAKRSRDFSGRLDRRRRDSD